MNSCGVGSRSVARCAGWMVAAAMLGQPCVARAAEPAAGPAHGAASPQALVDRLNAAIAAKDLAELVNCMDAASRVEASAGVLALTVMMVSLPDLAGASADISPEMAAALTPAQKAVDDSERKKARERELAKDKARLAAVLKRYKLPDFTAPGVHLPQGEARTTQLAAVDHGALVRDLLGLMNAPGAEAVDLPLRDQVRDLKVSGRRATARAGTEALAFVQRNGRWYLAAKDLMATPK